MKTLKILSILVLVGAILSSCDNTGDVAPPPPAQVDACSQITIPNQTMCFSFTNEANDKIGNIQGAANGATLAADRKGKENAAYQFDGIDDHISVANPTLESDGSFSVVMWAMIEEGTLEEGHIRFLDTRNASFSPNTSLNIYLNLLNGQLNVAGNGLARFDIPYDIGTWFQIAVVYDKDLQKLETYLNGVELQLTSGSFSGFTYDINDDMMIGARADLKPSEMFPGKLDDISIFNRAIEETEIAQLLFL